MLPFQYNYVYLQQKHNKIAIVLYLLNFDIKDSARTDLFTQQLHEIGKCILFMPRCYFLKTTGIITGKDIYQRIKNVLDDEDLFLLTPADISKMNGWLSSSTIEWLNN